MWSAISLMVIQLLNSIAACSFVGSSTSQVAKLHWQKYCPGMPDVHITSSNVSSFNPANLLVLISTTMSEIMQGSRASDISGMGKITLSWRYGVYLPSIYLSYYSGLFCGTFLEAGVLLSVGLCPGCIGLPEGTAYCVFPGEETGRSGQLAFSLLATCSSGKGFLGRLRYLSASEGVGEDPKIDPRIIWGIHYWWVGPPWLHLGGENKVLMICENLTRKIKKND